MKNKKIIIISFGLIALTLIGITYITLSAEEGQKPTEEENIEAVEESNNTEVKEVNDDFQRILDWDGGDQFDLEEDGGDMIVHHETGYDFRIPLNWYVKEGEFVSFTNKADNCRINIEKAEAQPEMKELINYLKEEGGQEDGDVEINLKTIENNDFVTTVNRESLEFTAESLINEDEAIFISSHASEGVDSCEEYFINFLND